MKLWILKRTAAFFAGALAASSLLAQAAIQDIPLRNWPVPPPSAAFLDSLGEIHKQVDITPGVAFVGIQPCRVMDTRGGGPFTGQYGPPIMGNNAARNVDINSAPHCPGIPDGSRAYSLNFTIVDTTGPGDLRAWPQDNPPIQVTSIQNWTSAGVVIANATLIAAGTGGGITVVVAGTNFAHVLVDINGYLPREYNPNVGFEAIGNSNTQLGLFQNNSTAARTFGVTGRSTNTTDLSAGVRGIEGSGPPAIGTPLESTSGVLGLSRNSIGVYGVSEVEGVRGHLHSAAGDDLGFGSLGHFDMGLPLGVFSQGNARVVGNLSVTGTITAGVKPFVEPHPYDAGKEIRYIAVEAPSADIYFRGTAQISQGISKIEIPEHFRFVARPGSYATMVTPIGAMATVAVLSEDENGIVVQASRNIKIHYVVYAERNAFRDNNPITENVSFRPDANGEIGPGLPESYREILIRNGTLNPDGTVNLETAKRLGWEIKERRGHGGGKKNPTK